MAKAFKDKENVEEGAASKFLGALGIAAALLAVGNQNKSDAVLKAIDAKIEMADTPAEKAALKKLANQRLVWLDTGKGPGGDIKVSDVGNSLKEVTIDLNEFIQKKLDEGKSQEDVVKLTKALMKKLHDKGEVKVNGTKLVFKENHSEQDTQLALPEPPARDYLGDDDKDYEGGMAKSQLYKMKSYADKLCNMVDDESQLEAWVQAKLTKASDYMSAVFHYLDYQNSKMNEAVIGGKRVDLDSLEAEDRYDDVFTYAEFEDGTPLTAAELDLLSNDEDTRYSYFGPGGKGHSPQHDF